MTPLPPPSPAAARLRSSPEENTPLQRFARKYRTASSPIGIAISVAFFRPKWRDIPCTKLFRKFLTRHPYGIFFNRTFISAFSNCVLAILSFCHYRLPLLHPAPRAFPYYFSLLLLIYPLLQPLYICEWEIVEVYNEVDEFFYRGRCCSNFKVSLHFYVDT